MPSIDLLLLDDEGKLESILDVVINHSREVIENQDQDWALGLLKEPTHGRVYLGGVRDTWRSNILVAIAEEFEKADL